MWNRSCAVAIASNSPKQTGPGDNGTKKGRSTHGYRTDLREIPAKSSFI